MLGIPLNISFMEVSHFTPAEVPRAAWLDHLSWITRSFQSVVESEEEVGDARWDERLNGRHLSFLCICICLVLMCFQGISGLVWCLVPPGAVWVLGRHSSWAPRSVRVRDLRRSSLAADVFPPPHQQRAPEVPANRKRSNNGAASQSSLRHRLKTATWSRLENYWWLPPLCFNLRRWQKKPGFI